MCGTAAATPHRLVRKGSTFPLQTLDMDGDWHPLMWLSRQEPEQNGLDRSDGAVSGSWNIPPLFFETDGYARIAGVLASVPGSTIPGTRIRVPFGIRG